MKKLSFLFLILIGNIFYVSALSIYLEQTPNTNITSGLVSYDVMLDPEGKNINAVSGKLSYSSNILAVESISAVDSFISNWIIQPTEVKEVDFNFRKKVEFEGMIPGGFLGERSPYYKGFKAGKLFTIVFRPKEAGNVSFVFENIDIRLNDGLGTKVETRPNSLILEVPTIPNIQKAPILKKNEIETKSSTLTADIIQDNLIVKDRWVLFFYEDTTRHSVSHFEVAESKEENPEDVYFYSWKKVSSPFILSNQTRNYFVHIKVIYNDGSFAYKTIKPVDNSKTEDATSRIIIITIAILIIAVLTKKFYAHFFKKLSTKK